MTAKRQDPTVRQALNLLLQQRLHRRDRARRAISVGASVLAHVGIMAAIALAPALAARNPEPIEFVQVQIVPLQALGVPDPVQPAPGPEPTSDPTPAPAAASEPDERMSIEAEEEERDQETPAEPQSEPSSRRQSAQAEGPPTGDPGAPAQRRGSPFGSPLATSPFGTAVAGFDNPDFVYGYYVDQMLAMIGSHWARPPASGDVEMMIHFRIQSDGTLTDVEVATSSGDASFDLAGLRAVQLASPLPPLPRSFPHDSLGVNLIIR